MSTPSHQSISTAAYQALRDALPMIVWYKKSFSRYVRTALRSHPELYADIDFEGQTKREAADELVDRLMVGENSYQSVTVRLILEIANMDSFPELDRHEDSDLLVAKARSAVSELKRHTAAHEQLIMERERVEAEQRAYAQQAELQRRFADELDELREQFLAMSSLADGLTPHERGRHFETFLNQLFVLFDLEPRLSYVLEREQIDGAFSFDTDDYVIEAKWTVEKVSREQVDAFASKVRRKGKNALGLFVSINGFSRDAINEYSSSTPFMTMDGTDLFCVLDSRARLDDLLRRKKRHANETGECYFPVSNLFT